MKYILILLLIASAVYSCNSSKAGLPSDFRAIYETRSALMNYELKLDLNGNKLTINYRNGQTHNSAKGTYTVKDSESKEIYNYLMSVNFSSLESPPAEMLLDMPEQKIIAEYDNKSNTINFGSVKEPTQDIKKLRTMIVDLALRYNSSFKVDLGF